MRSQFPDMSATYSDTGLLSELEPRAEELLERHLNSAKEWFPHQLTPWSRGKDFEPDYKWDPNTFLVPDPVRRALFVNLLTEDNLPYYFRTIERMFSNDGPYGTWTRRWTAEEGRHSIVLRDYLTVNQAVDPVALERARMAQVSTGESPEPISAADGFIYVALQELATRISHMNTGKMLKEKDAVGYEVMKRIAADENLHYLYYRDMATAALEFDPSSVVMAIDRQVRGFKMPGTGINGFDEHAKVIAKAGIYDLQIHHDQIIRPMVFKEWHVEELEGLSPEAELARQSLMKYIGRLGIAARRIGREKSEKADQTKQLEAVA